jgi:hypothetical protein
VREYNSGSPRWQLKRKIDTIIHDVFKLTKSEQMLVADVEDAIDFAHARGSGASVSAPNPERLRRYTNSFLRAFASLVPSKCASVSATIYTPPGGPLQLVTFHLERPSPAPHISETANSAKLRDVLARLDSLMLQQEGVNIFRRRHTRIYEKRCVHVLKPAEARFWTASAGLSDADETWAETLHGGTACSLS